MRSLLALLVLTAVACSSATDARKEDLPRLYGYPTFSSSASISPLLAQDGDSVLQAYGGHLLFRDDHTVDVVTYFAVAQNNLVHTPLRSYSDSLVWTFETRPADHAVILHHPIDPAGRTTDTAFAWSDSVSTDIVLRVPRRLRIWGGATVQLDYLVHRVF